MHGRIALAALLLLSACRLSDEQQIGVLRFVASSITGAVADAAPAAQQVQVKPVKRHQPCTQTSALTEHRLQHVHSRLRYAASRVERAMITVRRVIFFETTAVAGKCRTRPAPAVRS